MTARDRIRDAILDASLLADGHGVPTDEMHTMQADAVVAAIRAMPRDEQAQLLNGSAGPEWVLVPIEVATAGADWSPPSPEDDVECCASGSCEVCQPWRWRTLDGRLR